MAAKKVLVVEDDPVTRQVLQATVAGAGYQVSVAADTNGALTEAKRNRPDLVILDLGLPAGGGLTFLERLKLFPALSAMPIVVVSGKDRAANEPRAREVGASAYFQKPVQPEEILAAIARLIGT